MDELMSISPETFNRDKEAVFRFTCKTLEELKSNLTKIEELCKKGAIPLIFLDGHGHERKGIELCSKEFMSWLDFLDYLRNITNSARGELTVISALCHSMVIESMLSIGKPLPFSFYYGYKSEIPAGAIELEGKIIFESLLRDGGDSILKSKGMKISCYSEYDHVEKILLPALLLSHDSNALSRMIPGLSKRNIKSTLSKDFARNGIPLSGNGRLVEQIIASNDFLIELINSSMHDTERRRLYVNEVITQLGGTQRHGEESTLGRADKT